MTVSRRNSGERKVQNLMEDWIYLAIFPQCNYSSLTQMYFLGDSLFFFLPQSCRKGGNIVEKNFLKHKLLCTIA